MTESQREMLTAYVDGDLPSADRAVVEQLIQQSAEARLLLRQLQADAQALRELPRKPMPVDLSLNKYGQYRAGQGGRAAVLRQRRRTARLVQVAATVVLALGLGLAWFLLRGNLAPPEKDTLPAMELPLAQNPPRAKRAEKEFAAPSERKLHRPGPSPYDLKPHDLASVWQDFRQFMATLAQAGDSRLQAVRKFALQNGLGRPESVPGERILTSPQTGLGNPFKSLEYRLPTLLDLSELKPAEAAKMFPPGGIHYLDLSAQDTFSALNTLQSGFRKAGLPLIIDQELHQRQKRLMTATLLIYVENVTAEQVQRLLQHLAKDNGSASDPVLDSVLMQTLDEKGMRWLAGILGIPPQGLLANDPEQQKNFDSDPTKPISDATLKALLRLSAGQGRGGKPAPTVGLALAVGFPRLAPVSKDLRTAMGQRQGLQPGKVSLVFFVRASK